MKFTCKGHKNILSLHRNTLEFTKDKDITLQGDCIIGVNSNFKDVSNILKYNKIKMILETSNYKDEVIFEINKEFNDNREIVIRKTNFISSRTLGIKSNKAAKDLNKDLIDELKDSKTILKVSMYETT
tara:strand:+ start:79 stop:462 length:384 start_codon:yes stop_codon:yes gene_type:complete